MEQFLQFICDYAHYAHYIIFLLLLLTGLNIPISEDILILSGGVIASTCIPDHTLRLGLWLYVGACLSAWEAYWIGRYFGPSLYKFALFRKTITPKRIEKLHYYYEKFGVFTFMVGRFCPGGIRNGLFMTAGLGKMPFYLFVLRDCFAACFSVSLYFYLGYLFGTHYETLINDLKKYDEIAIIILAAVITIASVYFYLHSKSNKI